MVYNKGKADDVTALSPCDKSNIVSLTIFVSAVTLAEVVFYLGVIFVIKIKDFPKYAVNENGEVFNLTTNKKLKPQKDTHGYAKVNLYNNGKSINALVHRLVAIAFIENPFNYQQVNHIDEDKNNNNVSNLEWVTAKENSNFGTRNKRISDSIRKQNKGKYVKCIELDKIFLSIYDVQKKMKIHSKSVWSVCNGKSKTAGGYHWEYISETKWGDNI